MFCIASLSFGMQARLSEEAIKTMSYRLKILLVLFINQKYQIAYLPPPPQHRRNVCSDVRTSKQIIFFVFQGYFSFFFVFYVRVYLLIVVIKRTIQCGNETKIYFKNSCKVIFHSASLCIFQLCQRQLTTGMQE